MIFHAAVMLLVGLICGAPYGRAINRQQPAPTIAAWRVAHASLPIELMTRADMAARRRWQRRVERARC